MKGESGPANRPTKLPAATRDAPDLGPWLWPGGWLKTHLEDVRRLALSLFELEASAVRGLVDSAARAPRSAHGATRAKPATSTLEHDAT